MGLALLVMFTAGEYMDLSQNDWIGYIRPQIATSQLNFQAETISKIPWEDFAGILG
jgi:hypothetical protein